MINFIIKFRYLSLLLIIIGVSNKRTSSFNFFLKSRMKNNFEMLILNDSYNFVFIINKSISSLSISIFSEINFFCSLIK